VICYEWMVSALANNPYSSENPFYPSMSWFWASAHSGQSDLWNIGVQLLVLRLVAVPGNGIATPQNSTALILSSDTATDAQNV
jgi:hypothetical protein